ncbi:MAG: minor capsid protein [Bacteroides sp.]|nr:minor capsid protein [Bacteroides sp.]
MQALNQAFREAGSYNDFRKSAATITKTFNDTWQRTEYQTAVQMAEAASNYRTLQSQVGLFPIWRYRTAGDDHVREEHAMLNGLELPADHPKWKEIYPPNGWRCRCTVEPIMEDEHTGDFAADLEKVERYQATADWKNAKAQGWAVNRAELAEVFAADQMYIRKFPDMAAKYLGKLGHKEYGLPSFAARTKAATTTLTGFTGEPADWIANNAEIRDFAGKAVTIPGKTFLSQTSGDYGPTRVNLLGHLQEVLKNPDKVWFSGTGKTFDRYRYLKFFQGRAVVVECGISGQSFDVLSWDEVGRPSGKVPRNQDPQIVLRSGLLIKK